MKITKSFIPSSLADWRNWLAKNHDREQEVWLVYVWEAFQKVSPSYRRNYILWLANAKKPQTFERRFQILVEEVLAGEPTSMH